MAGAGAWVWRQFCLSLSEFNVGVSCSVSLAPVRGGRDYGWRLRPGAVLLGFAQIRCWSFLLSIISPCAGRQGLRLALEAGGGSSWVRANSMLEFLAQYH